jgi:hypothetical protein
MQKRLLIGCYQTPLTFRNESNISLEVGSKGHIVTHLPNEKSRLVIVTGPKQYRATLNQHPN